MEKTLKVPVPWAIAAVAGFLALRGLLVQATLQADLNTAMQGVLRNVQEAGVLTVLTAEAMAPLENTARTLATMNGRLGAAGEDLAAMNQSLERVLAGQAEMLQHLGSLNQRTRGVIGTLGAVESRNRALLETTATLTELTATQAGSLQRLSDLTEESALQLALLNQRFAFLR